MVSKFFPELTTTQLYEILRARSEIFVVEQNCVYQDMDGRDYQSLHVFYEEDGKVLAYLRAFRKEQDVVQIGRVITVLRGQGLGGRLLQAGIEQVREKLPAKRLYLEAQTYAVGYYAKAGFEVCSGEFLEDGLPHVQMMREL